MKKILLKIFPILFLIVVAVKISSWFFDYGVLGNKIINTVMFSVIGIYYILLGISVEKKLVMALFLVCGLYLVIMNFLPANLTINIIGIICVMVPLLFEKFSKIFKKN